MAITVTAVQPHAQSRGVIFPDSALAHRYCKGEGLEIGAAAHNPFNLPGARNVAWTENVHIWNQAEIAMCGAYANVDIVAEGDALPVEDSSQDYVISSHVLEHLPNPIQALQEWSRVVKPGGTIFLIVPHRDASEELARRDVTTFVELLDAFEQDYTVETMLKAITEAAGGEREHYWVFDLDLLVGLVEWCATDLGLNLEVVEALEKDDKVGNGYCLVLRQLDKPDPEPVEKPAPERKRTTKKKPAQTTASA
jgi:SAM-dependent methyltransferase